LRIVRDRLQFVDVADEENVAEIAELLRDPQPDVRAARENARVRMRRTQAGEFGERRRRVEGGARCGVVKTRCAADAPQRRLQLLGLDWCWVIVLVFLC
jgi:hypothetical protein